MKKFIISVLSVFIIVISTISAPEIWIKNYSTRIINGVPSPRTIIVKVYPVSMIFNGLYDYNLLANKRSTNAGSKFYYHTGVNELNGVKRTEFELLPTISYHELKINFDFDVSGNSGNDIAIGFGLYRVDVWWDNEYGQDPPDDYFTIEYDAGARIVAPTNLDLSIAFVDYSNGVDDPRIQFHWVGNGPDRNTRDVGRKIESWRQYENGYRDYKMFGDFRFNTGNSQTPNNYTIIPQDPRRDCVYEVYSQHPNQNHLFNYAYTINYIDYYGPADIGTLTLNLTIDKNVTTPDYLSFLFGQDGYPPVLPSPILITNGASLIINKGENGQERTFDFLQVTGRTLGTSLKIESGGTMELQISNIPEERVHVKFEDYCNSEIA